MVMLLLVDAISKRSKLPKNKKNRGKWSRWISLNSYIQQKSLKKHRFCVSVEKSSMEAVVDASLKQNMQTDFFSWRETSGKQNSGFP